MTESGVMPQTGEAFKVIISLKATPHKTKGLEKS